MSSNSNTDSVAAGGWTPVPLFYDFGRPFPGRHVVTLLGETLAFARATEKIERPTIYEPGAGTGRILVPLATHYTDWQFIASDMSADMLECLEYKAHCESLSNLSVYKGDVRSYWPPTRSVDILLHSSVLHAVTDWSQVLESWAAAMRPRGAFCLVGEEADLYNLALGRAADELSEGAPAPVLLEFWTDYLRLRRELGIHDPESSQVGCRWSARSESIVEELRSRGYEVSDTRQLSWNQRLTVATLIRIVSARSYSSMFTAADSLYDDLCKRMTEMWSQRANDVTVSRHVAVAVTMHPIASTAR